MPYDYDPRTIALDARKAIGLLTDDEVATMLQLTSATTLATWRSQKKGPPYLKIGKRVFYTAGDIRDWVVIEAKAQRAANDNQLVKAAA